MYINIYLHLTKKVQWQVHDIPNITSAQEAQETLGEKPSIDRQLTSTVNDTQEIGNHTHESLSVKI